MSDYAAARVLLREVDEIFRLRPGLGVFRAQAKDLRVELGRVSSSSAPQASALSAAELRVLPMLSTHLSFPEIDAQVYCSPLLGVQGLYPAVDPLLSRSRAIDERMVNAEHVETAERARDTLRRARTLMTDPILLELLANRAKKKAWQRAKEFPAQRMAQLSPEDRLLVSRARKLERFLTTPFFVAEPFTRRNGRHMTIDQTLSGARAILDGKLDEVAEDTLSYIGAINEVAG